MSCPVIEEDLVCSAHLLYVRDIALLIQVGRSGINDIGVGDDCLGRSSIIQLDRNGIVVAAAPENPTVIDSRPDGGFTIG